MKLHLLDLLANVSAGLCLIGCLYMAVSAWVAATWRKDREIAESPTEAVSILKPLNGREPRLFSRLASYCRQEYAGPVELVLGTLAPDDPALGVVEKVQLAFPEVAISCVKGGAEHGTNRKVSNLVNMRPHARHGVFVLSDSDIQVPADYLRRIVGLLVQPGVGGVTCLYHGIAGAGLASRLSAMSINTSFLPNVLLALKFRIAHPCFGATVCLRSETLQRIGGFAAIADVLADDWVLGARIRQLGLEVPVASMTVGHVCFEGSLRELVQRQLRVALTVKSIDRPGYIGSIVTHPLPWSLVSVACGQSPLLVLVAFCARFAVTRTVETRFGIPRQRYWLLPLQDVLAFVVYVASLRGTAVSWRGVRFRVRDGSLLREEEGA